MAEGRQKQRPGNLGRFVDTLGPCAANKQVLECSLAPPMCSQVLWSKSQTVGGLKLITGCWEPRVDSLWHWLAPKYLSRHQESVDKTVRFSQQKNRIQGELPGGTKLCWDECHFTLFFRHYFLYYYIIILVSFFLYCLIFLFPFLILFFFFILLSLLWSFSHFLFLLSHLFSFS